MPKILVTGGCGFLGSHVCTLFKNEGWDVVAYDNMTKYEYGRAGFRDDVRKYNYNLLTELGVKVVNGDVRDRPYLRIAVDGCDLVAHCAAQPAMTISIEKPLLDFGVNVEGTLNVLEACRLRSVPMVNCSSIHVYGNELNQTLTEGSTRFYSKHGADGTGGISEGAPIAQGQISPLHASKLAAEYYVRSYTDTYDLQAATFRLSGIYGPRQFGGEDHGWVAHFAIQTVLSRPIKIFGTDKQVRDILYVSDAAQAFMDWHKAGCPKGTYNIGGGVGATCSIRELLDMLKEITGKESPVEMLPARHGDLWWFVSDCKKARDTFGWCPTTSVSDGVENLVDWIESERSLF